MLMPSYVEQKRDATVRIFLVVCLNFKQILLKNNVNLLVTHKCKSIQNRETQIPHEDPTLE